MKYPSMPSILRAVSRFNVESIVHRESGDTKGKFEKQNLRVYWVQPSLMVLYLILGILTAMTHHLYYFSLHQGKVYMGNRQQWPVRIGSGLTVLTIALFNMAIGAAYTQHVWTRLRTKTYSLLAVDQLFALTMNATGLFSKEILMKAKSVALIALLSWILPLATTVPPATLSVSSVLAPFTRQTTVPTLQTNVNKGWVIERDALGNYQSLLWTPTIFVQQITARAVVDNSIGDIPAPAPNASYTLIFPGPAMKCEYATETQNELIEFNLKNASSFWARSKHEGSIPLVYSIINPEMLPENSFSNVKSNLEAIETTGERGPQFWISTPENNTVCLQGFSYYQATFNWTNNFPSHTVTSLNFTTNTTDVTDWRIRASSAVFRSLSDLLIGNMSLQLSDNRFWLRTEGHLMLTSIRGCDEIVHNFWIGKNISDTEGPNSTYSMIFDQPDALFPPYSSQFCRNRTLLRAMEDLVANISMSLLGSSQTSQNTTITTILQKQSQLLYTYDSTNLLITYAIVFGVSLIAVMFGFAALDENGVAHSLKFSAIMESTRSPELAHVTRDCGLGMEPLDKPAEKTRLKFGSLKATGNVQGEKRVGFVVVRDEDEQSLEESSNETGEERQD